MTKNGVCAVGSKSEIQRALFIASFSDKKTVIENFFMSEDIKNTVECLKKLSADIIVDGKTCTVIPFKEKQHKADFYVGENATLFRFLLAVCAFLGGEFTFTAEESLKKRPHKILAEQLEKNGLFVVYEKNFPVKISGRCEKGEFLLPGNVSSQYVSAVLIASPISETETVLNVEDKILSADYVKITEDYMGKFGVKVKRDKNTFSVSGKYKSPQNIFVCGDWSNFANFLALGALKSQGVTVKGLDVNSLQGDKRILDYLAQMGAEISVKEDEVTVNGGNLKGIKINCEDNPDIIPLIAMIACFAHGNTEIYGIERLSYKESDRIKGTEKAITDLGGKIFCEKDKMTVFGKGFLKGGKVCCNNDHRLIMAVAVISQTCREKVIIDDISGVKKSYPDFFADLRNLGVEYGT